MVNKQPSEKIFIQLSSWLKAPLLGPRLQIMKEEKGRVWQRANWRRNASPKPEFYLTEKEKKDGETSIIQRWLELADRLFDNDDSDPTPSAA